LVVVAANGTVVPIITLPRALGPSVPVGPSPLDIAAPGAVASAQPKRWRLSRSAPAACSSTCR
jgi:hypothetical protein